MTARPARKRKDPQSRPAQAAGHAADAARASEPRGHRAGLELCVLVFLTAMLLSARWFIPAEAAINGSTLGLANLWMLALCVLGFAWLRSSLLTLHWGLADTGFTLLCLGHVLSAVVSDYGTLLSRPTLNLCWEWMGLWAAWVTVRQLVAWYQLQRWLLPAVGLWAVCVAGLGLYQHYLWLPQVGEAYTQLRSELDELQRGGNPSTAVRRQALQRQLQQMGAPLGGPERMVWENRLLGSTEPLGTSALANTLAGMLVCWLPFWVGLRLAVGQRSDWKRWQRHTLTAFLVVLLQCLVLTKSRSAWAAALVALAATVVVLGIRNRRAAKIVGIAGMVVVALTVLLPAGALGIDREVWTEAPKSLQYRLMYWAGALDVVRERPLFGAGPGNFRYAYLQYKLPESSEEIADPHNWVLDLWIASGLIGLAGMAIVIVTLFRSSRSAVSRIDQNDGDHAALNERIRRWFKNGLIAGPAVAAFVLWTWGELGTEIAITAAVYVLLMAVCLRRLASVPLSPWWTSVGLLALLVHLCGAGGIELPAIVEMLIILAAATLPAASAVQKPRLIPVASIALVVSGAVATVACVLTATRPVAERGVQIVQGDESLQSGRLNLAARLYGTAAVSDPLSAEPLRRLRDLEFRKWSSMEPSNDVGFQQGVELARRVVDLRPYVYLDHAQLGEAYLLRNERTDEIEAAREAAERFGAAVKLYPTAPILMGRLAEAEMRSGNFEAAMRAAERAVELHEINQEAGHVNRLLPADHLDRLREIISRTSDTLVQ